MIRLASKVILEINNKHKSLNTFVFDPKEEDRDETAVFDMFTERILNDNEGTFIISDVASHSFSLFNTLLESKGYYNDIISTAKDETLRINPFTVAENVKEIEDIFKTFCYLFWDNKDEDLGKIVELVNAFAIYMFKYMPSEKRNMLTFKKLLYSLGSTIGTEKGPVPVIKELFCSIEDKTCRSYKLYCNFVKNEEKKRSEIGTKVIKLINSLTYEELALMNATDEEVLTALDFKSALFINTAKPIGKFMFELMENILEKGRHKQNVFVFKFGVGTKHILPNLHRHLSMGGENNVHHIIYENNLGKFMKTKELKQYFLTVKDDFEASVLMQNRLNGKDGFMAIIQRKGEDDIKATVF